ncbi:MAG: PAS domain S-box protein [Smithellaceae bacterium]|nr:PAS domain S-box protein [Smithellaceae bacterium]
MTEEEQTKEQLLAVIAALRASEKQHRLLFELAQEGIWAIDVESRTTFVNLRLTEIIGYRSDEMIGRHLFSFMDEQAKDLALRNMSGLLRRFKERRNFEFIHKDGHRIYTSMETSPITDEEGRYTGALAVITDITERRLAEEALKASEERFRKILKTAQEGFRLVDRDGFFLEVNDSYCQISGYSREELLTMNIADVQFNGNREEARRHIERIVQKGGDVFETRHRHKDESSLYLSISTRYLPEEDCLFSLLQDITARKRVERALQENESKLRLITDLMLDMVSQTDAAGVINFASPSHEKILGYRPDELGGHNVMEFIHPDDLEEVTAAVFAAVGSTSSGVMSLRFRHADGYYLWLETIGNPIIDEKQNIVGAVFASRDVTERKRMEERLNRLSMTDSLTGLHNRHSFLHLAEQQLKAAHREGQGLWLIYLDLDNLKYINDTWGHKEGDRVICDAAQIFRKTFREVDIIARLGGDEFAVLAKAEDDKSPDVLIERLEEHITAFNAEEKRAYGLAVSVGMAAYHPDSFLSLDDLLSLADEFMYQNKNEKRHRNK